MAVEVVRGRRMPPDSDLNLSFRLQQMTSMRVDPGRALRLAHRSRSHRFPFIYMVEPGSLYLTDAEIVALRKYLLNGGFLMLDDFGGKPRGLRRRCAQTRASRTSVFRAAVGPSVYHCGIRDPSRRVRCLASAWQRSGGIPRSGPMVQRQLGKLTFGKHAFEHTFDVSPRGFPPKNRPSMRKPPLRRYFRSATISASVR